MLRMRFYLIRSQLKGVSNCLESQAPVSTPAATSSRHGVFVRTIVLSIVNSFRMQATSASFFGLPAVTSRR